MRNLLPSRGTQGEHRARCANKIAHKLAGETA